MLITKSCHPLPWRSCSSGSSSSPSSSPVASSNSPAPWSVVNTSLHCNSHLHYTTIHCTTIYYTTPHYTILLYTTLNFLHYITLQYTTLHLYSTVQYSAAQCTVHYPDPGLELGPLQDAGCHTSLLFLGWFCYSTDTALHGASTLHCTALHCTALRGIALHCTALHCTALYLTMLNALLYPMQVLEVLLLAQCCSRRQRDTSKLTL